MLGGVVLNGLLGDPELQCWGELTGVVARYVVSKLRAFRNLKTGFRTHHPAKKIAVLHGLCRHSLLMQCLLRLLSSVRISLQL